MTKSQNFAIKTRMLAPLLTLAAAACSGGGSSTPPASPPPPNQAPQLTTTAFSENENEAVIVQLSATDANGDPVTVSLRTGLDASLFSFAGATLTLSGNNPFDFEAPADADGDNIYDLSFSLSDGKTTTTETVSITIDNVADTAFETHGAIALVGTNSFKIGTALTASDIDGDGLGDIIIGGDLGRALVVYGDFLRLSRDTIVDTQDLTLTPGAAFSLTSPVPGGELNPSVTILRDLDGDSLPEIVLANVAFVAAEIYVLFSSSFPNAGSVDLAQAVADGDAIRIDGQVEGSSAVDLPKVAAGDVDADGLDDLLVCSSGADTVNGIQSGAAYTVFGAAISAAHAMGQTIDLLALTADQGMSVIGRGAFYDDCGSGTNMGDTTGGGFDDLLIANSNSTGTFDADGDRIPRDIQLESSLIFGSTIAIANGSSIDLRDYFRTAGGLRFTTPPMDQFALDQFAVSSVGPAGDVNVDGFADFLIAMPQSISIGNINPAIVYLVFGAQDIAGSTGTTEIVLADIATNGLGIVIERFNADFNFGVSLNTLGDVDGDGFPEILIGSEFRGPSIAPSGLAGQTLVIAGSELQSSGTIAVGSIGSSVRGVVIDGIDLEDDSGHSLISAGDISGDGIVDLLISSRGGDGVSEARSDAGEVYVISGALIATAMDGTGVIDLAALFPTLDAP